MPARKPRGTCGSGDSPGRCARPFRKSGRENTSFSSIFPITQNRSGRPFPSGSETARRSKTVVLAPQRKWSIFLLPNSHTDIGYTELQSRVAKNQAEYLDQVVEFCRATDGYPDEAKFRWNIEIAWALENYLKNRPAEKVQALVDLLRSGRVELSGWYVNLSDVFAHEELIRAVLPGPGPQPEPCLSRCGRR